MAFNSKRDAIDSMKQVALDEKTALHKHPDDFELYQIAEYNPREMALQKFEQPQKIISVSELLQ